MQEYMREKRWQARTSVNDSTEPGTRSRRQSEKGRSQSRGKQKRSKEKSLAFLEPSEVENGLSSRANSNENEDNPGDSSQVVALRGSRTPFRLGSGASARLADMMPTVTQSSPATVSSFGSVSPTSLIKRTWATTSQTPEPQTILSAARTDPFDCLPMKLSARDQELFDFYANIMPACSYGFERRSPHAHNWFLSVFIPEAMKGAVCFQNTILVHAANTQAWVMGLTETPLAIEHRAKASQLLLHHYQQFPHDTSDATISATISAAALEDFDPRLERRQYAWMHWQAVVQKIRDRGGPAALVQHNRLQALINWSDYILSGYNGHGATFYCDHQSSPSHDSGQSAEAIARVEIAQQCSEFITFLKCTEHLALVHAGLQSNPVSRNQQPLRYSVFQPGQPLHRLLASPNGPRYTDTGQWGQIICRVASLMTINTAIWEYRHSTELSEDFCEAVVKNVMHNDLDRHLSVEALIQILLSGSSNPTLLHTERPWFVGRMLKVAKRLGRANFERLNDLLLRFLTLGPGLEPVMLDWENELRAEILQAPLVSYTARFM